MIPSRLKKEIALIKDTILEGKNCADVPEIATHANWVDEIQSKYNLTAENIDAILQDEVGYVFLQVLKDAGVYKRTVEGQKAFGRFVSTL